VIISSLFRVMWLGENDFLSEKFVVLCLRDSENSAFWGTRANIRVQKGYRHERVQ